MCAWKIVLMALVLHAPCEAGEVPEWVTDAASVVDLGLVTAAQAEAALAKNGWTTTKGCVANPEVCAVALGSAGVAVALLNMAAWGLHGYIDTAKSDDLLAHFIQSDLLAMKTPLSECIHYVNTFPDLLRQADSKSFNALLANARSVMTFADEFATATNKAIADAQDIDRVNHDNGMYCYFFGPCAWVPEDVIALLTDMGTQITGAKPHIMAMIRMSENAEIDPSAANLPAMKYESRELKQIFEQVATDAKRINSFLGDGTLPSVSLASRPLHGHHAQRNSIEQEIAIAEEIGAMINSSFVTSAPSWIQKPSAQSLSEIHESAEALLDHAQKVISGTTAVQAHSHDILSCGWTCPSVPTNFSTTLTDMAVELQAVLVHVAAMQSMIAAGSNPAMEYEVQQVRRECDKVIADVNDLKNLIKDGFHPSGIPLWVVAVAVGMLVIWVAAVIGLVLVVKNGRLIDCWTHSRQLLERPCLRFDTIFHARARVAADVEEGLLAGNALRQECLASEGKGRETAPAGSAYRLS